MIMLIGRQHPHMGQQGRYSAGAEREDGRRLIVVSVLWVAACRRVDRIGPIRLYAEVLTTPRVSRIGYARRSPLVVLHCLHIGPAVKAGGC